jgi:hypothetical protein
MTPAAMAAPDTAFSQAAVSLVRSLWTRLTLFPSLTQRGHRRPGPTSSKTARRIKSFGGARRSLTANCRCQQKLPPRLLQIRDHYAWRPKEKTAPLVNCEAIILLLQSCQGWERLFFAKRRMLETASEIWRAGAAISARYAASCSFRAAARCRRDYRARHRRWFENGE